MIENQGRITEQDCDAKCPNLTLSTYLTQYWADLVCDNPLVEHTLVEPNSCILLCDNHLKTTIDCEYDDQGIKAWRDQDGGEIEDESDIACN